MIPHKSAYKKKPCCVYSFCFFLRFRGGMYSQRFLWVPQSWVRCFCGPWIILIVAIASMSCICLFFLSISPEAETSREAESGPPSLLHGQHLAECTAWTHGQGARTEWRKEGMNPREQGQINQGNWGTRESSKIIYLIRADTKVRILLSLNHCLRCDVTNIYHK